MCPDTTHCKTASQSNLEEDLMTQKERVRGERGAAEDEMVGWHHRLDGRELEETPGDGGGQGNLAGSVHGVAKR